MIIRQEHMVALEQAAARGFQSRMLERMRSHFPKHAQCLSEPQQLAVIQLSAKRAQDHGLTAERSVALYLDLMCVLGSEFDTDPQIPWAAAILADRRFPTQADRIDLLHSKGWAFANRVSADLHNGLKNGSATGLVAAISEIRTKGVEELTPDGARRVTAEIFGRIRQLFPIKSEVIGDECVWLLIREAVRSATSYGIRNARGIWLFTSLMSVVGTGFDRDPQLPWASETLTDRAIGDGTERVNQLYVKALTALKQWWGPAARAAAS